MPIQTSYSASSGLGRIADLVEFPIQRVHLELTNICNFDCSFCPKRVMTRPNGVMDTSLAESIIDQVAEHGLAEKITFHVMGEPMLHPDFTHIVGYVRARGLKAGITTNGSFLDKVTAGELRRLQVNQVNISLQTPDEDSFETRKAKGISYEDYRRGILDAIRVLKSDGADTVIKLHFLVTKFNRSVKEALGHLEIIDDTPSLRRVFTEWTSRLYQIPEVSDPQREQMVMKALSRVTVNRWNVLEVAPQIHLETYLLDSWGNSLTGSEGGAVESRFGYCPALTDHFGVLWNGDLVLCCKDFDGKTRVGNVAESGLVNLLNSDTVLSVVEGFKRCRVTHPRCRVCLGGRDRLSAFTKQVGSIFFFRLMKWFFYNRKRLF